MKVFAGWTAPFPVSPILSVLSSLNRLVCVPLLFSPLIHIFSDSLSVSHLHVSLWVCLSVSHVPSPSLTWPWHWKHTFVLWLRKGIWNQPGWGPQPVSLPPAQPQFSSGLESSEPKALLTLTYVHQESGMSNSVCISSLNSCQEKLPSHQALDGVSPDQGREASRFCP